MRRILPLALIALALTSCGGDQPISVIGTMSVAGGDSANGASDGNGAPCEMSGGYSDIKSGAQVVVTDAGSKTLALGALGPGKLLLPNNDDTPLYKWVARRCVFPFSVANVPAGQQFYGVEVSHRGRVQYPADRIAQPLDLSLG